MFWRFWAAADASVERFISRDVDSRLMARDAVAVAAWEASDAGFHVVRDHPSHSLYPMSGGLWGARRGALPQVLELGPKRPPPCLEDGVPSDPLDHPMAQAAPTLPTAPRERLGGAPWPRELASGRPKVGGFPPLTAQIFELIAAFPTDSAYLTDMNFLNSRVWPLAMFDVMQHDAFTCHEVHGAPPDSSTSATSATSSITTSSITTSTTFSTTTTSFTTSPHPHLHTPCHHHRLQARCLSPSPTTPRAITWGRSSTPKATHGRTMSTPCVRRCARSPRSASRARRSRRAARRRSLRPSAQR